MLIAKAFVLPFLFLFHPNSILSEECKCSSSKGFELLARTWRDTCGPDVAVAKELRRLREDVDKLKLLLHSKNAKVFFSATGSERVTCHKCGVTFDNVLTDSHHAINKATGRFVAPLKGVYLFLFHALADKGSEVQLELMVREEAQLHLYDRDLSSGNDRYAMLGQAILVNLELGDEVYVRVHRGVLKGGGDATFTSFVGIRVDEQPIVPVSRLL